MNTNYFNYKINKTILLTIFLVCCNLFFGNAQVTTNSGSGLASTYTDLVSALTALNTTTITSTVVITLTGNETAPAGGYQITAQGTATNTITIQGNASTITASNAHIVGSITDAVFKLIGADYITLQNFIMQENATNIVSALVSNTRTEFGVGLFYESTTNGSQNNTIQNNIISLDRLYQNSFGIYSNTCHTFTNGTTEVNITAENGANSNNKFYGNTISNVNSGVTLLGSTIPTYMEENNEIGGTTTALGNTITNWGSNVASDAGLINNFSGIQGIYVNHQRGSIVSNNVVISANAGNISSFKGIFQNYSSSAPTGTFTNTINNNQITLNAITASTFQHITISNGVSAATINVTNNIMLNSSITGASTTMFGVISNSSYGTININNNTIKGWTSTATTGGFTGFIHGSINFRTLNINNNKIGEGTTPAITFSAATSGAIIGIANIVANEIGIVNILNNDIRGIVQNATGTNTNQHFYIQNNAIVANLTISDNTFTNITANTIGSINFIIHNYSIPGNGSLTFNNNSIITGFNKTGVGSAVFMFSSAGGSLSGTTTTFTNNNFSNITVAGLTNILGISNTNGAIDAASDRIVTGNTFNNWTSGAGTLTGISFNHIGSNSTISNNIITNFSTTTNGISGIIIRNTAYLGNPLNINNNIITNFLSTGSNSVTGIDCNNNSRINIINNRISEITGGNGIVRGINISTGRVINIQRNKIFTIQATGTNSIVSGIALAGIANSQFIVANNIIGNLTNPNANNTESAIIGINCFNATNIFTANVYNNTVYLNATSTGANFSTSAMYHTSSANSALGTLGMQNNIFINNSVANGTGTTAAFRRSFSNLSNFNTSANNNNFSAPVIYADGANFDTTLETYKTRVAPRETNSISETVNFISTNPTDATYLHINTAIATPLESNAIFIAGITTDFDTDIRQGRVGYSGTGTAPDIGADEFEGISCSKKPSVTLVVTYNQNATATPLTATGTNLLWYTTITGGTGMATAPTPITTTLGTTSYWVTQNTNGCESERALINVIIGIPASHLNFNAPGDVVDLGNGIATAIDPINTFTTEAWVYPTAINNGLGNDFGMIVGNYNTNFSSMQFMLRKEGANYVFWVNAGNGFQSVGVVNALLLNTWQHIAGVWNGNDIKIYINGVLMNTTTGVTGTSFITLNNPVRMGTNFSNEKFLGNIDEVRIWSRALTQVEIQNNMNCELPSGQTNLLAYYRFNQGFDGANNSTINTLTDSSGNNYNGTLNGFALSGTSSNWLAGSPINTINAPTANAQTFCNAATVANLVASGTNIKWYVATTGGTALVSTTPLTNGNYFASQTVNGCESVNRTSVVATITTIDQNISEALGVVSANQNGASYQWFQCPSTLITGETNQNYTPTVAGDYKVDVTLSGCTVTSSCVTVITLGNQSFSFNSNISVYPNPSKDIFYINCDGRGSIVIYDIMGKIIKTENLDLGMNKLDLSNYPNGIYLMKVVNDSNQTKTMKLIKQ